MREQLETKTRESCSNAKELSNYGSLRNYGSKASVKVNPLTQSMEEKELENRLVELDNMNFDRRADRDRDL